MAVLFVLEFRKRTVLYLLKLELFLHNIHIRAKPNLVNSILINSQFNSTQLN